MKVLTDMSLFKANYQYWEPGQYPFNQQSTEKKKTGIKEGTLWVQGESRDTNKGQEYI